MSAFISADVLVPLTGDRLSSENEKKSMVENVRKHYQKN